MFPVQLIDERMEPERHIEKLLRAYAKKRRADAGDFKLHPATRRMLQGEAARRAPEAEEESVTLWQLIRRQWLPLTGFAALIFLLAALFVPALSKSKLKSESALAMNKAKEPELAADGKKEFGMAASPVVLERSIAVAVAERPSEDESAKLLRVSPPAPAAAPVMAKSALAENNRKDAGEILAANQPAPAAPAAPAADSFAAAPQLDTAARRLSGGTAVAAGTLTIAKGSNGAVDRLASKTQTDSISATFGLAQNTVRFKAGSQADVAQNAVNNFNNSQRFRQMVAAPAPKSQVLNSFEVQQNGNAIAVVDSDGSIYNGTVLADNSGFAEKAFDKVKNEAAAPQSQVTQNNFVANNYYFRVEGSNRSLNQNVVFTGNFIAPTNLMTNAAQNVGGALNFNGLPQQQRLNASQSQQMLFNNSRINGTATINGTNQLQINAESAP